MKSMPTKIRLALMAGCAVVALAPAMAAAQEQAIVAFDIPAQDLDGALTRFGQQSGREIIISAALTRNRRAPAVQGKLAPEDALHFLLADSGLSYRVSDSGSIVVEASDPQSGSAAGDGADQGTVQALIVTAQKREENIQDVPIAMSAFSQEDLTRSQVATGADLMTQVPNMTFTKTNFTSYSIQIRGIGTQAISATVDPAVAVAFNNTPFLRAHFFEQEFYDMERVEVLRGPQGTLYGRNATAGVVNLISAKPKFHFEAKASADISNYSSHRLEGMLNLPLVEDKVALRLAGAWTKRDGYSTNQLTGHPIDGRDLWSTRLSLRVDPTENLRTNFIWEHFNEDDDRLRSGKQTCKKAQVPDTIGGVSTDQPSGEAVMDARRFLDQGCDPVSMYSPEAYQTPDGLTLAYYSPLNELGAPVPNDQVDVYASATQSRDLRVIESQVDPRYRATSDTVELNLDYDLTDALTLSSQTGYNRDFLFSTQDYNRFNTRAGVFGYSDPSAGLTNANSRIVLMPGFTGGVFCDPQIGCSDRLVAMDLATEHAQQFSQELRLASNFSGPFNFSLGANYLRYKTLEDYYVFINTLTMTVVGDPWGGKGRDYLGNIFTYDPRTADNRYCMPHGFDYVPLGLKSNPQNTTCGYIDTNPVTSLNGQGHNYFRNQNPYRVQSYALFGEAYYNITPDLKLTAGLRWTVDRKRFESIPSELLVSGYGYPVAGEIKQEWREPTGRLVLTWTPHPSFTDQTMVYGSYAHGYKAGGANPPGAVLLVNRGGDIPVPTHPATFTPEFIDAYEIGTKNTLLDGRLTANLTGFYYDYTGYQISEIVDRSAINTNFDAKIWGVELETDWRPLENLRFGLKLGYENTRVADGQSAVDLMDRTAGHAGWMVVKPFPTQASNCVLPIYVVAALLELQGQYQGNTNVSNGCTLAYLGMNGSLVDPVTGAPYADPPVAAPPWYVTPPEGYPGFDPYTAPNGGAGFDKDLSGHALPNAPKYTATITADYTLPLPNDWLMTLHGDFYQQSEAWTRIFNDPGYDKLKAYNNINLAAIFTNENAGWTVMAYVKNVLNKDNITGAFLNSDDSALTTNVFLNEPRLYGLRVTKTWTDSLWWSAHANQSGWYPFRVELDGYHQGVGGGHDTYKPALADLYPADLQFPTGIQNDISAGNDGGIKFTYQPNPNSWNVSASVRYGRAGGGTNKFKDKDIGHETCFFPGFQCHDPSGLGSTIISQTKYGWHSYYETTATNEEAHTFADFAVGKDFGIGQFAARSATSSLSLGIEYAKFKADSEAIMHGAPDTYFPHYVAVFSPVFAIYKAHETRINDTVRANRSFEGAGPELNWEAAIPLLNDERAGHLDLNAGLGGAVLFGRQQTKLSGHLEATYWQNYGVPFADPSPYQHPTVLYDTAANIAPRSKNVTVPAVNANLGLSYSTGSVKVSGGYRWERYYNVIDGGVDARKQYDRTLDGPYMKVSIGFGG